MIKEIQYTSIKRVLDNLTDHPLLRDVTLEQTVRHVIRFIGLHGYPGLYEDRIAEVPVNDFRGLLPCDLVSVIQVRDKGTGICMRSMTDTFPKGLGGRREETRAGGPYIPPARRLEEEPSFKTQGRVIFTSFPEGCVEVAYKAVPCDDDGLPLLIDNENYLAALEAYIKERVFTVKFDTGKINANVLQNAQQEYAWRSAELMDEFTIPSVSEMEGITRMMNTLMVPARHFDNGFRDLGNREYLRRH